MPELGGPAFKLPPPLPAPGAPGGIPAHPLLDAAREAALKALGESFRPGAGQELADLMKIGRHADYREAVRRGEIPDIQAQATMNLLRGGGTLDPSDPRSPTYSHSAQAQVMRRMIAGGGSFGMTEQGHWGMLPPSGMAKPPSGGATHGSFEFWTHQLPTAKPTSEGVLAKNITDLGKKLDEIIANTRTTADAFK